MLYYYYKLSKHATPTIQRKGSEGRPGHYKNFWAPRAAAHNMPEFNINKPLQKHTGNVENIALINYKIKISWCKKIAARTIVFLQKCHLSFLGCYYTNDSGYLIFLAAIFVLLAYVTNNWEYSKHKYTPNFKNCQKQFRAKWRIKYTNTGYFKIAWNIFKHFSEHITFNTILKS